MDFVAGLWHQRDACGYFKSGNGTAEGKQSQCVFSLSPEASLNGCHAASQVLIGVALGCADMDGFACTVSPLVRRRDIWDVQE